MLQYLQLSNVGPAPNLIFKPSLRLNLITGDNGLGKSFLLDVAWWALTRRWPREINARITSGYPARPIDVRKSATIQFKIQGRSKPVSYKSHYSAVDQRWIGPAGRPTNPGLVIYAHADGGLSVWDPARNYWRKRGNVDVQDRLPGYVFAPNEIWDGLTADIEGKRTTVCNGLILDWASWIRERSESAANMAAILRELSETTDTADVLRAGPLVRIDLNDVRDMPSIVTRYASTVPIVHASAGVRRIVALAYILMWSWNEHVLACEQTGDKTTNQVTFLIDELESHLHPRWQRSILGSLLRIVQLLHPQAKTQLIVATHSPLVLASAEALFDPKRDGWYDFDLHQRGTKATVELQKREYIRRGDISNWLTSEAFDLKQARSRESEQAISKALELLRKNPTPPTSELKDVDAELNRVLGDIDPFWVRWNYFLTSHGVPK